MLYFSSTELPYHPFCPFVGPVVLEGQCIKLADRREAAEGRKQAGAEVGEVSRKVAITSEVVQRGDSSRYHRVGERPSQRSAKKKIL